MNEKDNVTEQLKELISVYGFNRNTVSRYLEMPIDQVDNLIQGDTDFLPDEPTYRFQIFNKIISLYASVTGDKDLKLRQFLQVLLSEHKLSKQTIAKIANVEIRDIEKFLSYPPQKIEVEVKYKIAITVMVLRFFLKDCESKS